MSVFWEHVKLHLCWQTQTLQASNCKNHSVCLFVWLEIYRWVCGDDYRCGRHWQQLGSVLRLATFLSFQFINQHKFITLQMTPVCKIKRTMLFLKAYKYKTKWDQWRKRWTFVFVTGSSSVFEGNEAGWQRHIGTSSSPIWFSNDFLPMLHTVCCYHVSDCITGNFLPCWATNWVFIFTPCHSICLIK